MKELYELKERLIDNLKGYSKKELTGSTLEVVDKLTHTIKNLCKIIEDMDGEYSMDSHRTDSMASYRGTSRYMHPMSYADGRGRGRDAQRDYRGRYSSDGDLLHELRVMRDEAPDEKTRTEFDHFIRKMESM